MTENLKGQYYQKALELVKQGENEQALQCLLEHLRSNPNDSEALNDTGAVCFCMGKNQQAIEFLEKAVKLSPDSGEIYWNLAEAYLASNMPAWAASLFDDIQRLGLDNFDLYNRTAKLFVDKNDKANAVEMLLKSLELSPGQDLLYPMIEVLKSKRPKVLFFCNDDGNLKSLSDILNYINKRFEVKVISNCQSEQVAQYLVYNDIIWFESVSTALVEAVKGYSNAKIIVNINESDMDSDLLGEVKWENVDKVLLPNNNFAKSQIFEKLPMLEMQTSVVSSSKGINLKKIQLQTSQRGKNIVCVDDISADSNPMLLLQCMQKLSFFDREYKLFFAGKFIDCHIERYMRYMVRKLGLDGNVFFDNCTSGLNEWLENKDFIVSASICENQYHNVLCAMAAGLKPVIHRSPSASEMFPEKYLFGISEDFCEQVLSEDYHRKQYRNFVEEHFSQNKLFSVYKKALVELEKLTEGETASVNYKNSSHFNQCDNLIDDTQSKREDVERFSVVN